MLCHFLDILLEASACEFSDSGSNREYMSVNDT